jgi:hypothetical protein
LLTNTKTVSGFYTSLVDDTGRARSISVLRLIGEAYVPNTEGHNFVYPLDGNPENLTAANVLWGAKRQSPRNLPNGASAKPAFTPVVPRLAMALQVFVTPNGAFTTLEEAAAVLNLTCTEVARRCLPGSPYKSEGWGMVGASQLCELVKVQ